MLAIENKRENHPILNQIYGILVKFHSQEKQITLCKVPAHTGIKGNEVADKAPKQVIDMSEMTTTRLPHTDYYLFIRRARNSEWQREWENNTSKLHYIIPRIEKKENAHNICRQYEVKLSMICIGNTRLTHKHLMSRNNQQPTCRNAAYRKQSLTIKNCL